jgi:hypothetical protein
MYCAGCGQVVTTEAVCSGCGMPIKARQPGTAAESAAVYQFGRTMRRLRRFWFLFAGLNVALGALGVFLVQFGMSRQAGPWEPWPHPPLIDWTFVGGSGWTLLIVRTGLALAAGMGLRDRTDWVRLMTGIAAIIAMTQFPFGLLLGAYTLVKLLGKRNAQLFKRSS